ncbi:hypothetical protein GJAV_G00126110 [Gymnothorax javanicus]|nr:hypothetical protein GJAV_G00126110 [Gymnothorax javanicus]
MTIQTSLLDTEDSVATFKGTEFFCYDLSLTPIQSSTDEITLSFRTLQRNGLMLHTGKSADYVNLSLKSGAVWLVINLGSGAFEALVEPVNGKFNDNAWHDVRVTRNLRQRRAARPLPVRDGAQTSPCKIKCPSVSLYSFFFSSFDMFGSEVNMRETSGGTGPAHMAPGGKLALRVKADTDRGPGDLRSGSVISESVCIATFPVPDLSGCLFNSGLFVSHSNT